MFYIIIRDNIIFGNVYYILELWRNIQLIKDTNNRAYITNEFNYNYNSSEYFIIKIWIWFM